MNTTQTLAEARSSLHAAVAAISQDDTDRRRQYALSALSYATAVILDPDATTEERRQARLYFDDAKGHIAAPAE